jgi:hypothetical protein
MRHCQGIETAAPAPPFAILGIVRDSMQSQCLRCDPKDEPRVIQDVAAVGENRCDQRL